MVTEITVLVEVGNCSHTTTIIGEMDLVETESFLSRIADVAERDNARQHVDFVDTTANDPLFQQVEKQ